MNYLFYTDQPTTCPRDGARTDYISPWREQCPDCGEVYRMFDDTRRSDQIKPLLRVTLRRFTLALWRDSIAATALWRGLNRKRI